MSQWISLSAEELNDYQVAALVTALREEALGDGQGDPFDEILIDVTSQLRQAILSAPGEPTVSEDEYAIPRSLRSTAIAMITESLYGRLGREMGEDLVRTVKRAYATKDLVASGELKVEPPETPSEEETVETIVPVITARERQFTRDNMDGL